MLPVASLADGLLSLLFPDRCAGCGRMGAALCPHCRAALAPYPAEHRAPPAGLAAVYVAYVFQGPLRGAVHQLKYRGRRRLGATLGALLAGQLPPVPVDAVMPIPLHPARLRERGFNQAELLARGVAGGLGVPLEAAGIIRVRATTPQALQPDAHARHANVSGAFAWEGPGRPPARVLLVDDVLTTGATMSACAQALRASGCQHVLGCALARSRHP